MGEETDGRTSRLELVFALIVTIAAFSVFSGAIGGDFVYDDTRQIVRNPLIQEPSNFSKALTSDVWAFKGDGTIAASNYWRPTFTGWSILNFQVFGAEPFGWHLSNLILHALTCLLGFLLLQRFGISVLASFAISIIFAVHPVHAESVAWIAGSPDLLFALFFLVSVWFVKNYAEHMHRSDLFVALGAFALALGSKEIALLCLPIFWLVFYHGRTGKEGKSAALRGTLPFGLLASLYFVLRWVIIGRISMAPENPTDALSAVLSSPSIFVFYLKQVFLPLSLSINYPLRPVSGPGFADFVLPLAISALALAAIAYLARRSFAGLLGAALFLLPLLPVFNLTAFNADQVVHDRYLYLPLLGLLLMLIPAAGEVLERFGIKRPGVALAVGCALLAVPLAVQSYRYSLVWRTDLSLWENAVRVDPLSSTNFSQYGAALESAERFGDAVAAYNRSLDVSPNAYAYLGKARSNIRLKRFEEATWDLKTVTEMPPESVNAYTLYQAYEALAISLSSAGKLDEAESALSEAIERLPIYRAALSAKLAVVLYLDNRKPEALTVLEGVRKKAVTELLPESKTALFRLGALYAEMGRREDAKSALEEYLRLTASFGDKDTLRDRAAAAETLNRLR